MLKIDNLHATVGDKPILKGLTFSLGAGEIHAIMGPNGAGKSTLGYVLSGRPGYEVTEGTVTFTPPPFASSVDERPIGGAQPHGVSSSLDTNGDCVADRVIIKDFTLRIQRGDRIGIVGANGTGKTTLIRMLTGESQPDSGKITLANTLTGIVIDQQRKLLEGDKKVRDVIADGGDWIMVRGVKKHVQGYLKDFLFDPSLIDAKIATLSGGERSRILLAREFAREANLLVLDEPTNDLDLETLDLLQEVIADYDGTVLIVSHDRDFLDRTVTLTLGLDGSGTVDIIAGGYADWVAKRDKRDSADTRRKADKVTLGSHLNDTAKSPAQPVKLSYKDQRDYDLLPKRIAEIDTLVTAAETEMADATLYTRNPDRFAELMATTEALRVEKDTAEERWLELAMLVEEMAG